MASQARSTLGDEVLDDFWPGVLDRSGPGAALRESLSQWADAAPAPLVLMIDEIDALVGASLLSVLRQLRAGYPDRPERFPRSVVLCGVRDVRDYRIHSESSGEPWEEKLFRLGGGRSKAARLPSGARDPARRSVPPVTASRQLLRVEGGTLRWYLFRQRAQQKWGGCADVESQDRTQGDRA